MDTKSGYPFWVIKNGLLPSYPALDRDARCDVLVIGGGITSALIADHLSRHGHGVIVLEKRDIGWGSTAASTALLQYESDVSMVDLAKQYDEQRAALAYAACVSSVEQLAALARSLGDVGYLPSDSLYLASKKSHVKDFVAEQELRRRYELPSRMLSKDDVAERYSIDAPAALLTSCGAVVDPYRFACKLFARAHRRGVEIYDRTTVESLTTSSRGVIARTHHGHSVRAGHVIIASGYETMNWLKASVARRRSSYACISDPIDPARLRQMKRTILWESARPYHYVRTTTDHRILVGGEDDTFDIPQIREHRVNKRARSLVKYIRELLPDIPFELAFSWAGTFAETPDGMPYFGAHEERGPRVLYAMAYGGNGITYSLLGATVLRAAIEKTDHPLAALYSFDRGQ